MPRNKVSPYTGALTERRYRELRRSGAQSEREDEVRSEGRQRSLGERETEKNRNIKWTRTRTYEARTRKAR